MKKYVNHIISIFFFLLVLCLHACNRTPSPISAEIFCAYSIGPHRTIEEAEKITNQLLSRFETKASPSQCIANKFCVTKTITKGESQIGIDTLMYVFNLTEDGFVIVAADIRDFPLVAYVEKGQIDESLITGVPPFDEYLRDVLNVFSGRDSIRSPRPLFKYETFFMETGVEPLINVKWGQRDVYGAYCPNGVAGCVATAIAQIMTKHSTPSSFTASVPMGGYSVGTTVPLTWNRIKQHRKVHYTTTDSCYTYHSEISALLREIGDRVNMEYHHTDTTDYSTAYSSDVPDVFNSFGYSCSNLMAYRRARIIQSLNNGNPVYMSGSMIDSISYSASADTTFSGHAFVIDGYINCGEYYQTYIWNGSSYVLLEETEITGRHVFHINWGWNEYCDGYFPFDVFNTDMADEYDQYNASHAHSDYQYHRKIIVDIHPSN